MENEKTIVKADIKPTLTNLVILWYALTVGFLCIGFAMDKIKVNDDLLLVLILMVVVFGTPAIIRCIVNNIAKQCSLSLTEKSITGNRKTLFAYSEIKLPIDKVDSIMASHSFLNILTGGDTLLIRSASGAVKFLWVHNAKEFVDATLAKIEEFKQSVKDENQNLVSAVAKTVGANSGNSSSAQKIKELKELLDSGLITQEEFETKRKELLDKM